jgi:carotenoid 1,2-hydratase
MQYCAMNVSIYSAGRKYWSMTERTSRAVTRSRSHLQIGPSYMRWRNGELEIQFQELAVPRMSRMRGTVRLRSHAIAQHSPFALDSGGIHYWRPIAPSASATVDISCPSMNWHGSAYFDTNHGSAPLEAVFASWEWSRCALPGSQSAVQYRVLERSGAVNELYLLFGEASGPEIVIQPVLTPVSRSRLPHTLWRLPRSIRSEGTQPAQLIRTLEDGPFYARSLVRSNLLGQPRVWFHETLSLDRFKKPWVQWMLPFRMPRVR